MAAEAGEYDRESEMIEVSVGLFIASMALEEGDERRYLEHLRIAQAHLTGLILDAEKHGSTRQFHPTTWHQFGGEETCPLGDH